LLEALERDLLALDSNPRDLSLTDSAFRALHTLKGSGAMFGFNAVAEFVHGFETIFDRVRRGEVAMSNALVGLSLQAKDHIANLIAGSASGGENLLAQLAQTISKAGAAADTESCQLTFRLPDDAIQNGASPGLLLDELRQHGATNISVLLDRVPPLDQLDPEKLYLGWVATLPMADPDTVLDSVFMFLRDDMEIVVAARHKVAPATVDVGTTPARADRQPPQTELAGDVIRVAAGRLDDLMDRIGELVIAQARLTQIAHQIGNGSESLKAVTEDLDRLIAGLRDTTMGIRMVPIETIYGRFRRLVRDLASDLGKDIRIETSGGDTELDKSVIDRLADPIVHLIRNAVDHGLEPADFRIAANKPSQGAVILSATYSGTEVAISIRDDGRGLDVDRIRAKAIQAGLMNEADRLADSQIFNFIFAPGFSTAAQVTALSGRGVGMDVVKRTVEDLRGRIELRSEPGQGTTATIRLPLTLAIIDGMHVGVGDERYVVPLSAVIECVEVPPGGCQDTAMLDVRGTIVPLVDLRAEFGAAGEQAPYRKIVIVSASDVSVGLVVDHILGNAQTVVKQLSRDLAEIKAFSGATILGNGHVSLIIDPSRIADHRLLADLGRAA
jgi:two-component system chemotaxis sensor kinase CheA